MFNVNPSSFGNIEDTISSAYFGEIKEKPDPFFDMLQYMGRQIEYLVEKVDKTDKKVEEFIQNYEEAMELYLNNKTIIIHNPDGLKALSFFNTYRRVNHYATILGKKHNINFFNKKEPSYKKSAEVLGEVA